MKIKYLLIVFLVLLCVSADPARAQTTEFTFQGKLTDAAVPSSATYDFQFALCASAAASCVGAPTNELLGVAVTNGVFTVNLDFGAPATAFPGADRFLEISVRRNSSETFVTLAPRQMITSAPYAVRTLNSNTAINATQLEDLAAGDFIKNSTTRQTANFSISGDGFAGGILAGNSVDSVLGH